MIHAVPVMPAVQVINAYCRVTGVTNADLCSQSRAEPIVRRRHELMYLLRQFTTLSLDGIGTILGGRDASTVQEAIHKVADRIAADASLAERLRDMVEMIRAQIFGAAPVSSDIMRTAAVGVLRDLSLSDADARQAALTLLSSARVSGVSHAR